MRSRKTIQSEAEGSWIETVSLKDWIIHSIIHSPYLGLGVVRAEKEMLWAQSKPCICTAWVMAVISSFHLRK